MLPILLALTVMLICCCTVQEAEARIDDAQSAQLEQLRMEMEDMLERLGSSISRMESVRLLLIRRDAIGHASAGYAVLLWSAHTSSCAWKLRTCWSAWAAASHARSR